MANIVRGVELYLDINDPNVDFSDDPNSYGTPKTTADLSAYTGNDFRIYRYTSQYINGLQCFGTQVDIGTNTAPKIDPSRTIGLRDSLSVTIQDFIDDDAYSVQGFYADRAVKDTSHFSKLIARNHIKNKKVVVFEAELDANNKIIDSTRINYHYIVNEIKSPTIAGKVSISLVDALQLTDIANKKMPAKTNGVVVNPLNTTATTLIYSSVDYEEEYGAIGSTGSIQCKEEIFNYTVDSATQMTIVRAVGGTGAVELAAGDTLQKCEVFNNENIMDCWTRIHQFSNVPDSYLDVAAMNALKAGTLSSYNLTRYLYKPTTIKDLFNELILVGGLAVWTDVKSERVKIEAAPVFDNPVKSFGLNDYMADKFTSTESYKNQITREIIRWGNPNPTNTDETNYRSFGVISVKEAVSDLGYEKSAKDIKTEWLIGNDQIAAGIVNRDVQRYEVLPSVIDFETQAANVGNLASGVMGLGAVFEYEKPRHMGLNADGTTFKQLAQCISLSSLKNGNFKITGLSYQANIPANVDYYINSNQTDYMLANDASFNTIPDFQNNVAREYVVVVSQGVLIDSSSAVHAAFRQGVFPSGSTLKLIIAGEIIGKGGAGGSGVIAVYVGTQDPVVSYGTAGSNGGNAIDLTTDATIDNLTGLIAGGGGGGAGGPCTAGSSVLTGGTGGGGGRGSQNSDGGNGSTAVNDTGGQEDVGEDGDQGTRFLAGSPRGGDLGEDGDHEIGALGGSAGAAIQTNSNSVTITAGNNANQIKGAVT